VKALSGPWPYPPGVQRDAAAERRAADEAAALITALS
jgi:hypothetical protein